MYDPANTITDPAMDIDGNGDQTENDSGYGGSDRSSDSSRNSTSSMHTALSSMSADSGNASDRRSSVNSNSSDATFQSLSSQSLGSSGYAGSPNSSRRSSLLSDCSDSSTSTMRSDRSASTMRSSGITPSTPKPQTTIQVFVRMSNKTDTIHIRPTETIRQFKKKIQEKSGISPSQLKLKFQGKMLMDENATLQYYGIQDCSSVEQSAALCGGSY